jgi:hypothetical protein
VFKGKCPSEKLGRTGRIARMIETVQNSPEHMRQAVYDLARYKLQEEFTHAGAKDIRPTPQAFEIAIRGVEELSKQQIGILPPQVPQLDDRSAPPNPPAPEASPPVRRRPPLEIDPTSAAASKRGHPLWLPIKRTAAMLVIIGGGPARRSATRAADIAGAVFAEIRKAGRV